MKPCCHGFTMVLVFLNFVVFSSFFLLVASNMENFLSMLAILSSIRLYLFITFVFHFFCG